MSTPAIAERFERERLLGLENEGREPVNAIVRHEYARDAAQRRLKAIDAAEGECQTAIEAMLATLQVAVGCTDKDRLHAIECMWETLSDMTYDARREIENEIVEIDDAIAEAEDIDLRRSIPVRL